MVVMTPSLYNILLLYFIFAWKLSLQKNFHIFPLVIGEPFKLRLHIL